jgi:hypothetical protein
VFRFDGPFEGQMIRPGSKPWAERGAPQWKKRLPFDEFAAHDHAEMARFLHIRLSIAERATARARWFGGRLYNRLAGDSTEYTELSGTHLVQALTWAGVKVPEGVQLERRYLLRLDVALRAYREAARWCAENDVEFRSMDVALSDI